MGNKKAITRSIMLENYGGKRFEKFEVYVEGEDFEKINKEVDEAILKMINRIPKQQEDFEKAHNLQPPF